MNSEIGGHDLTFWSKPLTIAEYQAAKRASKDPDDLLETTACLFIKKALDESGRPQFQADALPVLMRDLSMETASALMGAMNDKQDEEEEEFDIKSPQGTVKRENSLLAELHVAKELGMTLTRLRNEITYEELWLWITYFGLMNDQQEEQMKKARMRRQ